MPKMPVSLAGAALVRDVTVMGHGRCSRASTRRPLRFPCSYPSPVMKIMSPALRFLTVVLIALASASVMSAQTTPVAETPADRDARMAWWREARFGMFIHWGVYAVPAGYYQGKPIDWTGEWIMRRAQIPVAHYKAFANEFTAANYDPESWAALAEEAGMKYVVITSKHHDGFALFDSQASDWNALEASPAKRDLIAPLAEATRRRGLRFGLYYSQAQDWINPGGAKWESPDLFGWDEAHKGRFDDYLAKVGVPQAREILTKFQPDILWWDTPTLMTPERAALFTPLLALKPGLITNDRLGGDVRGDLQTPEQHIPGTGLDYDWEVCMTMNDTWGFKRDDVNWKSTTTLIQHLCDIASKGGNFLLNVGPTADGVIPEASVQRLREIGAWMKANGEAIYGTTASPFTKLTWGRCTQKTRDGVTTLYLHVFDWPADGRLSVDGLKTPVTSAKLLASGQSLELSRNGSYPVIAVPAHAPDPHASVIALTLEPGPLAVDSLLPRPGPDGVIVLNPKAADLHSSFQHIVALSGPAHHPHISHPTRKSWVAWTFETSAPGTFEVLAEIATTKAGSRYQVACGASSTETELPTTSAEDDFASVSLGTVTVAKAGAHELTLRPVEKAWHGINLRRVTLKPRAAP
ncbi:MAG TPA: alpha-L-fucosidase [Opitutus sp.]|nr:alpha-L-fucosidase [Opitutus sp.]